jgi:two-component system, LytTR family, sensor kinase
VLEGILQDPRGKRCHTAYCTQPLIRCIADVRELKWGTIPRNMADTSKGNTSYNWFWIAGPWAALGILDATQNVFAMRHEGMHHSWVRVFLALTLAWLPWALATPIVIRLGRRYPLVRKPVQALIHLSTILAIDLAASAWATALQVLLQPWVPDFKTDPFLVTWPLKFFAGLVPAFILYCAILLVTYVLDSRAKAAAQKTYTARLNEQLSYAQLNALQRQIEPHFIFNTLNSVAGLVRENRNDAAVSMIVALSDFLRRVAGTSIDARVRLAQEVESLEKYLQIQQMRFGGRLKLDLQIPEELCEAQIPSLLLQPLAENAIKHGIAMRAQGGEVRVVASRADGVLHLNVYNDGPLLDRGGRSVQDGIGLSNLRTRLELLYGTEFELRLENYGITGVQVSVTLPYREV